MTLFELRMLGDATERRYRRMRPDIESLPWGTIDRSKYDERTLDAARRAWTLAAFQEHRTGAACARTLEALITARAPLDLIAVASRFPLDEMAHVEMCARVAMELGGAIPIDHDPKHLIPVPPAGLSPLLTAADCAVRYFCVGEALSIPLLRGTWKALRHPLLRAVMGRIVKDEAAHGAFGFTFLDWAMPELDDDDRVHLAKVAGEMIGTVKRTWRGLEARASAADSDLAWMETPAYLALARRSLERNVVRPLLDRGITPAAS